jgi:streptogramin lyase
MKKADFRAAVALSLTVPVLLVQACGGAGSTMPSTSSTQPRIVEYTVPTAGSFPDGITTGPDGALWFTEQFGDKIGRMTTSGHVTEFPLPTPSSEPLGITTGPDGALWFAEWGSLKIGRITTQGAITEYPANPQGAIVGGPDGALWFTGEGGAIDRITTSGNITVYPFPSGVGGPYGGITVGPDGALWATCVRIGTPPFKYALGRETTAGGFSDPIVNSCGQGIAVGSDGALWWAAGSSGAIVRMGMDLSLAYYPTPGGLQEAPNQITAGPDGALWFTVDYDGPLPEPHNADMIGRITTAGVITEIPTPTQGSMPGGITVGPDGALWFTEANGDKIGRLSLGG